MDGCRPDHIPQQNWPTPCNHQPRKPNHKLWSRTSRNWFIASSFLTFCPHLQIRTKQRKLNMLPYAITFLVVPPPASPDAHQSTLKAFSSYSQQSLLPTESASDGGWLRPIANSGQTAFSCSRLGGLVHFRRPMGCLRGCSVNQSCLTLWDLLDCSPPSSSSWDFPGKNTGVGCHFLLQGIFPTQGLNPRLLHCRQILYCWAIGEVLWDILVMGNWEGCLVVFAPGLGDSTEFKEARPVQDWTSSGCIPNSMTSHLGHF